MTNTGTLLEERRGGGVKAQTYIQGLIQKEKVHTDCQKGAQNNIFADEIATQ